MPARGGGIIETMRIGVSRMDGDDSIIGAMRRHPRFAWLAFVVVTMFTSLPFQARAACPGEQAQEPGVSDAHHRGHGMRSLPPCCSDAAALTTGLAVPRANDSSGPVGSAAPAFWLIGSARAIASTRFADALLPARSYCERSRRLLR